MAHSSAQNWWAAQAPRIRVLLMLAVAAVAVAGARQAIKGHGTAHVPKLGTDITLNDSQRSKHPYLGFNSFVWRVDDGITPGTFVRLLKTAGATMVRDTLDWEALEPTPGKWNEHVWNSYVKFYELLRTAKITPLWTLQNAPSWATIQKPTLFGSGPNCRVPFGCLSDPPAEQYIPAFVHFAQEAIRRMPASQLEVWNEPNLPSSWQPYGVDPAYWTKLQCAVYKGVKSLFPRTIVVSGGVNATQGGNGAMGTKQFLQAAYDNGLNNCMDDLGVHVYPSSGGFQDDSAWGELWRDIVAVRNNNGDSHPVYESEVGIPTGGRGAVSDGDQAAILEQAYQRLKLFRTTPGYPPINAIVIHTLMDYTSPGHALDPDNPEPHFGVLKYSRSTTPPPKPAFCWLVKAAKNTYPGC